MCGIFAVLGKSNCYKDIIKGLKILQNRGYDSAGICSLINGDFILDKFATDDRDSIEKLEDKDVMYRHNNSNFSISHTRWATHGIKSDVNSHPHSDKTDNFTIVHNGIIENNKEIKEFLMGNDYNFRSQTDTEVLVNLISYNYYYTYFDEIISKQDKVIKSIQKSLSSIIGTMGVCLIFKETPNSLYVFRRGSPIVFSNCGDYVVVASEQSALQCFNNKYILPEEDVIITFEKTNDGIKSNKVYNEHEFRTIEINNFINTPAPYRHWTIKEIHDIPHFAKLAINKGGRIKDQYSVKLGGLESYSDIIKTKKNIIMLACGTSLYAAKFVKKYYNRLDISNNIQCVNACEFDINDYSTSFLRDSLFVIITQSGETYDLIKVLDIINDNDLFSIGIVNKVGSYIATNTICGVYVNSGIEMGVAATKSYINQVFVLLLLGIFISQNKNTAILFRKRLIENISNFTNSFSIDLISDNIQTISSMIKNSHSMFILGSFYTEPVSLEGSLKIKELTYIHCESYSIGELKHGPLSLIHNKIPIIYFCLKNNDNSRLRSSLSETKIRGSFNIIITDFSETELKSMIDDENIDCIILIPSFDLLSPLVSVIPIQLISYYTSLAKGINPDKPRNLAKTVTVE